VDIISGGTPCQDLSAAGARRGMTEGTRSNLWVQMREAIAIQQPAYVVWENVRGAYSAEAASNLEFCPGCMGTSTDRGVVLRALGRVLGDLSDLGYDTQWRGLRAGAETNEGYGSTHVGSCHARFRVFVLAAHRDHPGRRQHGRTLAVRAEHSPAEYTCANASYPEGLEWGEGWTESAGFLGGLHASIGRDTSPADAGSAALGEYAGESSAKEAGTDSRDGLADSCGERPPADRGPHCYPAPDPDRGDDDGWLTGPEWDAIKRIAATWSSETNWGEYESAIRRWEFVIGRPAPRPTERTGRNDGQRLSPLFTEWMMGLPYRWVTNVAIGISRNEQLKACGNGVVPQQAMAALRDMLAAFQTAEVAA